MIDSYVRQHEAFAANGGGSAPAWLQALRRTAIDRFRETGFPAARDEEWRFTSVAPIARADFAPPPPADDSVTLDDLDAHLFGRREWPRLVFVNGRYTPSLSSPGAEAGVEVSTISEAIARDGALVEAHLGRHVAPESTSFTALNTALSGDGAFIRVAAGVTVAAPVQVLFVTTDRADGSAMYPRLLMIVEREARAQVIESYVSLEGKGRYLNAAVAEVAVAEGAWVEHSRIQRESEAAFHVAFTEVDQERDSHYRSFSLAMGGAIARHNLHARLGAPNTEALLYGLSVGRGDQLIDNHTTIYHDKPDCRSWEVYKSILDERAHGVFNGKIFVQPEAQKTDAKQTNRTLLLSDTARIDTKPQLEIFADDVKCTHGATIGNLDEMASFYFRSRGIPEDVTRKLLVYAFAAEVLDEVASEPVRTALDRLVHQRLGVGQAGGTF